VVRKSKEDDAAYMRGYRARKKESRRQAEKIMRSLPNPKTTDLNMEELTSGLAKSLTAFFLMIQDEPKPIQEQRIKQLFKNIRWNTEE